MDVIIPDLMVNIGNNVESVISSGKEEVIDYEREYYRNREEAANNEGGNG